VQNVDAWEQYLSFLSKGELPLGRALPVQPRHMMIRELILQLKTGKIESEYFQKKFGVDILKEFAQPFHELAKEGYVSLTDGQVEVSRDGLLQVDRLLPAFFDPEHWGARYT
jgi:oxygen-independent coproporphyrinogen-3 oxidase